MFGGNVWRCTHAKLAPLTPHPLTRDRHNGPTSWQGGTLWGRQPFCPHFSSATWVCGWCDYTLSSLIISGLDGGLAAGCLRSRPAWIVFFCFHCWVADGKNEKGDGDVRHWAASGAGWRRLWVAPALSQSYSLFLIVKKVILFIFGARWPLRGCMATQ